MRVICLPGGTTQGQWDGQQPGTLETLTVEEHEELTALLESLWEEPTR